MMVVANYNVYTIGAIRFPCKGIYVLLIPGIDYLVLYKHRMHTHGGGDVHGGGGGDAYRTRSQVELSAYGLLQRLCGAPQLRPENATTTSQQLTFFIPYQK